MEKTDELIAHIVSLRTQLTSKEKELLEAREVLQLTLNALIDLVRQLPMDERLADYNLDYQERAEATATQLLTNKTKEG